MLSQQHSDSEASEDAESVASQLQPLRSGELQAQVFVPELNELEGGSMMALPKEPSRQSVASGYGPPVTKGHCAAMQPSVETVMICGQLHEPRHNSKPVVLLFACVIVHPWSEGVQTFILQQSSRGV